MPQKNQPNKNKTKHKDQYKRQDKYTTMGLLNSFISVSIYLIGYM